MGGHKIIFDSIDWVAAGVGARYKAFVNGKQRVRLAEFSEGFVEADWCQNGHVCHVLSGSFSVDYNGTLERYTKGDVVFMARGEKDKHKAVLGAGEKVTLLLFELLD